jgi:hypothetical protein
MASINEIINAERAGLLDDEALKALNDLRSLDEAPPRNDDNILSAEEFEAFKTVVNTLGGGMVFETDLDYANLYGKGIAVKEGVTGFVTNPTVQKEVAITGAGIAAPMLLAPMTGGGTLPIAITNLITRFPKLARVVAAFTGGYGAAQPFTDTQLQALGYGVREAAGEGVAASISSIAPAIKSKLTSMAKSDMKKGSAEALEQLAKSKQILTPAIVSENRTIDLMENLAENAWFGGGKILKARKGAVVQAQQDIGTKLITKFANSKEIAKGAIDDTVEGFLNAAGKNDYDVIIKNFITNGKAVQQTLINTGYKNIDKAVQAQSKALIKAGKLKSADQAVDITGLKKWAKARQTLKLTDDATQKVLNDILKLGDEISFSEAQQLRSLYLSKTSAYSIGGTTSTKFSQKIAGEASNIFDKQMQKEAEKLGGDVDKLWRAANEIYSTSKSTFNSQFMTKLIKKGGEDKIFSSLIKAKNPHRIKEFRNLILKQSVKDGVVPNKLAAEKLWRKVQSGFFSDVIYKSFDESEGVLAGKKLLNTIKSYGGPAIKELFANNPKLLTDFKTLARTLELAQTKGIQGVPGGMFIQLTQASMITKGVQLGGAAFVGYSGTSGGLTWGSGLTTAAGVAVVLGGPNQIAKLFTNPAFVKGLTATAQAKIGSYVYTRGVVQLVNSYMTAGIMTQEEGDQFIADGIADGNIKKFAKKELEREQKKDRDIKLKEERKEKIKSKVKSTVKTALEFVGV